jgi:hypothetical protein
VPTSEAPSPRPQVWFPKLTGPSSGCSVRATPQAGTPTLTKVDLTALAAAGDLDGQNVGGRLPGDRIYVDAQGRA